jgi:hypothetical protein
VICRTDAQIDDAARAVVATWPPLTPGEAQRLAAILAPHIPAEPGRAA